MIWKKISRKSKVAPNLIQLQDAQNQARQASYVNINNSPSDMNIEQQNIAANVNLSYNNAPKNRQLIAMGGVILTLIICLGVALYTISLRLNGSRGSTSVYIKEIMIPFMFEIIFPVVVYMNNKELQNYVWREIGEQLGKVFDMFIQ